MLKIWATETFQRISELLVETCAELGATEKASSFAECSVNPLDAYYLSRATTIGGGSNEIQRGVLSKQVLRLPDA